MRFRSFRKRGTTASTRLASGTEPHVLTGVLVAVTQLLGSCTGETQITLDSALRATDGPVEHSDAKSVPAADAGPDGSPDAAPDAGPSEQLDIDPKLTESITARSSIGQRVTVIVPRRAIRPDEVAVLVNEQDPQSVAVAEHYLRARAIPAGNRIAVRLPIDTDHIDRQTFATAKAEVDAALEQRADIQALAVTWTQPWRVEGMSITTAFALGFDEAYFHSGAGICSSTKQHDYFISPSVRPYDDHRIRPAMMLAGRSAALVRALVDRSVAAEATFPRGHGYFVRTSNSARSDPRARDFRQAVEAWDREDGLALTLRDNATGAAEQDALRHLDGVLFYFTGLARVPDLHTNTYVPGAVADHLTGFGGQLIGGFETSVLRWLEAGASASYGTVREPCAMAAKFPATRHLLQAYLSGATVVEAYWKSVQRPGEGLFVGDPLTRPFGTRVRLDDDGQLEILTSTLEPGKRYALYAANSVQGPFVPVQDELVIDDWPTFTPIRQRADRPVYALVERGTRLAIRRLTPAGTAIEPSISGDRVVWESTWDADRPAEVFLWEGATQRARPITHTPSSVARKIRRRRRPEIFGNTVVWRSPADPLELVLYDVQTQETRRLLLEGASNDQGLQLDGDRLVWADDRNGNADVFLYNTHTRQQTQLTSDPAAQVNPALAGERVVWQDSRYGDPSIQLLDLNTGQQRRLSTPSGGARDINPAITAEVVVWRRELSAPGGFAHVVEHVLQGGEQRRISAGWDFQSFAWSRAVSGSQIVWPDGRHGAEAIYLYDRDTGQERRISHQGGVARLPAISGQRIVWELWRPTGSEIYLLDAQGD